MLALAAKHPRNLTNGTVLDVAEALSSYNEKQFHHVFPRAHLRRQGTQNDNILLNICMLSAAANKIISDKRPVYLLA